HMTVAPVAMESTPSGARVPGRVKSAIMRALEKDPAKRPNTVREFVDAFSGVGQAPSVPPPGSGVAAGAAPRAPPEAPRGGEPAGGGRGLRGGGGRRAPWGPPGPPMGGLPPYGTSPQGGPPGMAPAVAPHYGTPSAGNHAVPGIPAAPPRDDGGGGGRGLI